MTTKKGDFVRGCFNAWVEPKTPMRAWLTKGWYRVEHVTKNGEIRVRSAPGCPMYLRSWVRVSL